MNFLQELKRMVATEVEIKADDTPVTVAGRQWSHEYAITLGVEPACSVRQEPTCRRAGGGFQAREIAKHRDGSFYIHGGYKKPDTKAEHDSHVR